MEKGFKIIFYTLLGTLFFGVLYLTTVMYMSPRQDAKERGFIPCTKELVVALQMCQAGSLGCPFRLLVKDMGCNIGVVGTGFADWVKGKQSTPWANYLFEPQLAEDEALQSDEIQTGEGSEAQSPELQAEFVRKKLQELEQAKHRQLNIQPSDLLQNPDQKPATDSISEEDDEDDVAQDNIDDEANIKIVSSGAKNTEPDVKTPNKQDTLRKIQKQTEEKLQKGNLKDEK